MSNDSTDLYTQLKDTFGFSCFRKGQEEVITKVVQGKSVLAIFPTGAGKSLCYQMSAVLLPGLTLVISPLLSLMHDQMRFLKDHGIVAAVLDSTLSSEQYHKVLQDAKNGNLKILMISVERFRNERFRNHLQGIDISLLVVDEAHCISEWGHNFRPEYIKIPIYKKEFSIKTVLLLTATATMVVADDVCRKFEIEPANLVWTGFYRENLHITVCPVNENDRIALLVKRLKDGTEKLPAIIYTTLQKTSETVALELKKSGIEAFCYHAGMKDEDRVAVQNKFMQGDINCVVATIAFGMGIDKNNIRSIIHYDLPKSIEEYSQEIGRGGRDGLDTSCLLLANRLGLTTLQNFVYGDTPEKESIFKLIEQISKAGSTWEVKLVSLSNSLNIRLLPLKTALVYLEMEGVISSKYSYFNEYHFKTRYSGAEIVSRFSGEPAHFLHRLLKYAVPKKVWIDIDLLKFSEETGCDRKRAVSALEYLDSKEIIELEARQSVDVYNVLVQSINPQIFADKIYSVFLAKEEFEIKRIYEMVEFFESDCCLSYKLAKYFQDDINDVRCGHCSVCNQGAVKLLSSVEKITLEKYDIGVLSAEVVKAIEHNCTPVLITRFLCGITTPVLSGLKFRKMANFGLLETYNYHDVLNAVEKCFKYIEEAAICGKRY